MRARLILAVSASAGLGLSACTNPSSTGGGVDVAAVEAPAMADAADPAQERSDEPLVIQVEEDDRATPAAATPEAPAVSLDTAPTTTIAPATTPTTTTTSQPATTTIPASTTTTTSAPDAAVETRPEILRLALPTFGGGTFDPDSVAGRNIVLWFWGAH